ncbi:hypothetical protein J3R83DRAFT_4615 [Lanmaoa asiatica]|nr:hypothetical protein J3R83DRAFT_4615 [Lanmaoa asiatica]
MNWRWRREKMKRGRGEGVDGKDAGAGAGAGWTAWTAGLLGANATPSRSPTPVQTFGAVMTSPRPRHATSLKQLHAQASTQESSDQGPLAGLNLRIPMPSPSAFTVYASRSLDVRWRDRRVRRRYRRCTPLAGCARLRLVWVLDLAGHRRLRGREML